MATVSYESLVQQARQCIGRSDAALWQLAKLTARAVKQTSAARWGKDIGYTEARVRGLVRVWDRYGRNRIKYHTFSDHLTLARMRPEVAAERAEVAVEAGCGYWGLQTRRNNEWWAAESKRQNKPEIFASRALEYLALARNNLTAWAASLTAEQRRAFSEEVQALVVLERAVNNRRRKLRIA